MAPDPSDRHRANTEFTGRPSHSLDCLARACGFQQGPRGSDQGPV